MPRIARVIAVDFPLKLLKAHERIGRPLGTQGFINLESLLKRSLKKNKPGPKGKHN